MAERIEISVFEYNERAISYMSAILIPLENIIFNFKRIKEGITMNNTSLFDKDLNPVLEVADNSDL
ncbi:MAG: hypothetical protein ABGX41_09555, partial [Pseudohongiella sp.]